MIENVNNELVESFINQPELASNVSTLAEIGNKVLSYITNNIQVEVQTCLYNIKNGLDNTLSNVKNEIDSALANIDSVNIRTTLETALKTFASEVIALKGESSDGAQLFTSLINLTNNYLTRFLTTRSLKLESDLKNAILHTKQAINSGLSTNQLKDKLSSINYKLKSNFRDEASNIKQMILGFGTSLNKILTILRSPCNIVKSISRVSDVLFSNISITIQNIINTTEKNISSFSDESSVLVNIIEDIKTQSNGAIALANQTVSNIGDDIKKELNMNKSFENLTNVIATVFDDSNDELHKVFKDALLGIIPTIQKLYGNGENAIDAFVSLLDVLVTVTSNLLNRLKIVVSIIINNALTNLETLISDSQLTIHSVSDALTNTKTGINALAKDVKSLLQDICSIFDSPQNSVVDVDTLSDTLLAITKALVVNLSGQLGDAITTIINNATSETTLSSIFSIIVNIKSNISEIIDHELTTINKTLVVLKDSIDLNLKDVNNNIQSSITNLDEAVTTVFSNSLSNISNSINDSELKPLEASNEFKKIIYVLLKLIGEVLNNLRTTLSSEVSQTLINLAKMLIRGDLNSNLIKGALNELKSQIAITLKNFPQTIETKLHTLNDILKGITRLYPNPVNAIQSLMDLSRDLLNNIRQVVDKKMETIVLNISKYQKITVDNFEDITNSLNETILYFINDVENQIKSSIYNLNTTLTGNLGKLPETIRKSLNNLDREFKSSLETTLSNLSNDLVKFLGTDNKYVVVIENILSILDMFIDRLFSSIKNSVSKEINFAIESIIKTIHDGNDTVIKISNTLKCLVVKIDTDIIFILNNISSPINRVLEHITSAIKTLVTPRSFLINVPQSIVAFAL